MSDSSTELIKESAREHFSSDNILVHELAGDASARRYFRLIHGDTTWVVMKWQPFDASTYPFLSVSKLFTEVGCRVPKVERIDEGRGILILEDLGDLTLERKFWESLDYNPSLGFYEQAIDELIKIHFLTKQVSNKTSTAFTTEFDKAKFLWEMNYAYENLLLKLLNLTPSPNDEHRIKTELDQICEVLVAQPKVICHRDYHSRNLMIKLGQTRVIDFQDARLGPIPYDLVSLLYDSYVDIPKEMQDHLLNYYFEKARPFYQKSANFEEVWTLQIAQRCFKACGTFSAIYNQRQDTRYLKYLPKTLRTVVDALHMISSQSPLAGFLEKSGALDVVFES